MRTLAKKHPLVIRCCHWLNVILLFMMLWSGLLIYWANPVYRIGIGSYTLFPFFPERFFVSLGVPYRLAEGMALHFLFMWLFAVNGLVYVVYTAISGEWRALVPRRHAFREAVQVLLHDLHLSRVAPPPRKFNGAQQIAYTAIVVMGAGSLVTGLAIYKPVQFAWLARLLGGYEWARAEHFWLAVGYVLFFVVHVAQVVRAGWNTFQAVVTGYEIVTVSVNPPVDPPVTLVGEKPNATTGAAGHTS